MKTSPLSTCGVYLVLASFLPAKKGGRVEGKKYSPKVFSKNPF